MTHFVYLIITKTNKQFISYVGYTKNLKKRVKLHNYSKGAKFTRGRLWKLAFFKSYKTKSHALKEEYKLKKNYSLRSKIKNNFVKNENFSFTSI